VVRCRARQQPGVEAARLRFSGWLPLCFAGGGWRDGRAANAKWPHACGTVARSPSPRTRAAGIRLTCGDVRRREPGCSNTPCAEDRLARNPWRRGPGVARVGGEQSSCRFQAWVSGGSWAESCAGLQNWPAERAEAQICRRQSCAHWLISSARAFCARGRSTHPAEDTGSPAAKADAR